MAPNIPGTRAFDELHAVYRAPLLRYFSRRIPEAYVAEDLVQQVFERLLRRGDLDKIDNVAGYVFQTARSVITDYMRRRGTRQGDSHESFEETVHGSVDFSPERVLAKRQRLARVMEVLQTLPERTRVIFVLRRVEGLRYREIADRFGISVSAVEKHMERATAQLAKCLEEEL